MIFTHRFFLTAVVAGLTALLVAAPVPEPGKWAAAALLAGGTAFARGRKRAKAA